MLSTLKLLAPALIPSWNFFDVIAASPRIEYALTESADTPPADWREFRPRPDRVSLAQMAARLVWNPRRNEDLFLVSCAERLLDHPTAHSDAEIARRIAAHLTRTGEGGRYLHYRLILVSREGDAVVRHVAHGAEPRRLADIPVR